MWLSVLWREIEADIANLESVEIAIQTPGSKGKTDLLVASTDTRTESH